MDFFGFRIVEDVECELCGAPAVDINHIEPRGMGGNPACDKDEIENLIAVCRKHHEEYGDVPDAKPWLTSIHLIHMRHKGLVAQVLALKVPITEQINKAQEEINRLKITE